MTILARPRLCFAAVCIRSLRPPFQAPNILRPEARPKPSIKTRLFTKFGPLLSSWACSCGLKGCPRTTTYQTARQGLIIDSWMNLVQCGASQCLIICISSRCRIHTPLHVSSVPHTPDRPDTVTILLSKTCPFHLAHLQRFCAPPLAWCAEL